tara:strand:+ start:568 stop:807 length:240 start_codon:yes stop_codon:yes gene_type:complete
MNSKSYEDKNYELYSIEKDLLEELEDSKEKILADDDVNYSNKMAFYKIVITTQERMNKTTDKYLSEVANSWLAKQQEKE